MRKGHRSLQKFVGHLIGLEKIKACKGDKCVCLYNVASGRSSIVSLHTCRTSCSYGTLKDKSQCSCNFHLRSNICNHDPRAFWLQYEPICPRLPLCICLVDIAQKMCLFGFPPNSQVTSRTPVRPAAKESMQQQIYPYNRPAFGTCVFTELAQIP